MRSDYKCTSVVAAVVLGFAAGNVVANSVERLKFIKADLYTAAKSIHDVDRLGFLFANHAGAPKSFEIDAGAPTKQAKAVAEVFGKSVTTVATIVVFEDGLRERATATERLDEMNAWLSGRFSASDARRAMGESDAFREFLLATQGAAKELSGSIGAGKTVSFRNLPPEQQQTVLDLARAAKWSTPTHVMASLMDQWAQYRHPDRTNSIRK